MSNQSATEIRKGVRESYTKVIQSGSSCCGPTSQSSGCCQGAPEQADPSAKKTSISRSLGYSSEQLSQAPTASNPGLGCGNPHSLANIKVGETVLDLGAGAGLDAFIAARSVGPSGKVIGVDMTAAMVEKARHNLAQNDFSNVEFRLGEIENLPVADQSIDVIISNCVINLSPEKEKVFAEAMRVLKPGGRLAISDIVSSARLPDEMQEDLSLIAACVGGASAIPDIEAMLKQQGFTAIQIQPKDKNRSLAQELLPDSNDYVLSASIEATKPI